MAWLALIAAILPLLNTLLEWLLPYLPPLSQPMPEGLKIHLAPLYLTVVKLHQQMDTLAIGETQKQ